jgi:hypothetical protein
VTVGRADLTGVAKNAVSGLGLVADAAMVTFPVEMFQEGADLSAVEARKREVYDGLTRWQSALKPRAGATPMLTVEGSSYEDALTRAHHLFLARQWGDGLPLWPATGERVDWILRGSALPRSHVIGKFMPRGGITSVETCAIALAMAGGRPEYLPVLLAAVDAILDPKGFTGRQQATSCSPFVVVIVNGPIAEQIRLNSGFGLLGPDPQHPAGACIGRALRLLQQNVGGAVPGEGTIATFGAMRYTNAVFAENDDALPAGWPSHGAERHGFAPGSNSVSLLYATGVANMLWLGFTKETPQKEVQNGLYHVADYMRTPNLLENNGYEQGTPGIVMLPPVVAQRLVELGWTKARIREFLWENSKIPMAQLERGSTPPWIEKIALDPWPITRKPDNIVLLVAGGNHPRHAYWIQSSSELLHGRSVRLPDAFDQLLADAERDLGAA